MYHYVTDKVFLKESYSICADLVNQLVQRLKKYDIESKMSVVGSKKRGLVTQNEKEPIDYDFNLYIFKAPNINDARSIKQNVIKAFNEVLNWNDWGDCEDSTSAITTEKHALTQGNKTPFSIDICIIKIDSFGNWHRLIHRKTGNMCFDQYYWNQGPKSKDIQKKEEFLKTNQQYWQEVMAAYLTKKNMYLSRQDVDGHPSFICYIESINEVYNKMNGAFS